VKGKNSSTLDPSVRDAFIFVECINARLLSNREDRTLSEIRGGGGVCPKINIGMQNSTIACEFTM